jgi:hypothetical protein
MSEEEGIFASSLSEGSDFYRFSKESKKRITSFDKLCE